MKLKVAKQVVREFLHNVYTDKNLTQLLDHARAGKFSFYSCCCLIGIVTADHKNGELVGRVASNEFHAAHYIIAERTYYRDDGRDPQYAAYTLSRVDNRQHVVLDSLLQKRIIPMILSEIKRRERDRRVEMERSAVVESETSPVL